MSDARTLPSDLFVPEVCLAEAGVEFVDSLQSQRLMGTGPDAPIRLVGFDQLSSGGQFVQAPILEEITDLVTRRDITSQSDVDTKKFTDRNDRGVLINMKVGPVSDTKTSEQISKLQPGQLEQWFAKLAIRNMMRNIQSACINALYGGISAVTAAANTYAPWAHSTRTNLDTTLLARLNALTEDSDKQIKAWIFRSEPFDVDLIISQLGAGVQGIADVVSGGGNPLTMGKVWAKVNDAILKEAVATGLGYDKYRTLGLAAGAIEVELTRPLVIYTPEERLKSENVETIYRGDFDIAIRIPGLAFSTSFANPTNANLADSSKWTYNASDHREVGAYMAEHNYSGA